MCSNGISKVAEQIKKETKLTLLAKANGFLTIVLVCVVMFTTMSSIKLFTKTLATYVPPPYLSFYKTVIAAINTSRVVELNMPPYVLKSIKIEPYTVVSSIGLLVQTFKMIVGRKSTPTTVNHLLCWIILFLISWVRFSRNFSSYILFVEVSYVYFHLCRKFYFSNFRPFVAFIYYSLPLTRTTMSTPPKPPEKPCEKS